MALCNDYGSFKYLFPYGPNDQSSDVLKCRFSDFSLKPSSYCGTDHDNDKNTANANICLKSLLDNGWKLTHFATAEATLGGQNYSKSYHYFIFEK